MADLFTASFDVGANAPLSVVSEAVADLHVIGDAAMEIAQRLAEADARRYLSGLVVENGVRALVAQMRRREIPIEGAERDLYDIEEFEYMFGAPTPRRRVLAANLVAAGWTGPWAGLQSSALVQRLMAVETAERLPGDGFRFQSLSYANPITAEMIAASGTAAAALGYLLAVIATLGPRRRRESARADAEVRIQAAHARDAEDLVERRIELRRILLDQIARGEVQLRPDDVTDALLANLLGAADRLGDRQLTFERRELPAPS